MSIKCCPFCGNKAKWISNERGNLRVSAGEEYPMRALGCSNKNCKIKPHTVFKDTYKWEQGKGNYKVNFDKEAIEDWNNRKE